MTEMILLKRKKTTLAPSYSRRSLRKGIHSEILAYSEGHDSAAIWLPESCSADRSLGGIWPSPASELPAVFIRWRHGAEKEQVESLSSFAIATPSFLFSGAATGIGLKWCGVG